MKELRCFEGTTRLRLQQMLRDTYKMLHEARYPRSSPSGSAVWAHQRYEDEVIIAHISFAGSFVYSVADVEYLLQRHSRFELSLEYLKRICVEEHLRVWRVLGEYVSVLSNPTRAFFNQSQWVRRLAREVEKY